MFEYQDFDVFEVEGLDERMAEVRRVIQPKFQVLDERVVKELEPLLGEELIIHIAQHRRRTTNAPDFTWSAMGGDKRGYKKYPHFTLGINGEYIVMWLSFIDNPLNEKAMADALMKEEELFASLPEDFMINLDHTVNTYHSLKEADLTEALTRWRDVKKGEFQLGRVLLKTDELLNQPEKAIDYMVETYVKLVPFYQLTRPMSQV